MLNKAEIEKLKESEEKYHTIFESLSDAIVYLDRDGKILDVNRKIENVMGYKPKDVIGKTLSKIRAFSPKDAPLVLGFFREIIKTGKAINPIRLEVEHKDGSTVFIETSSGPVERNGRIEGVLTIVRDITERREIEEDLEKKREELEAIKQGLEDKIEELERLSNLTVGRELRMIELKKRIRKLQIKD